MKSFNNHIFFNQLHCNSVFLPKCHFLFGRIISKNKMTGGDKCITEVSPILKKCPFCTF